MWKREIIASITKPPKTARDLLAYNKPHFFFPKLNIHCISNSEVHVLPFSVWNNISSKNGRFSQNSWIWLLRDKSPFEAHSSCTLPPLTSSWKQAKWGVWKFLTSSPPKAVHRAIIPLTWDPLNAASQVGSALISAFLPYLIWTGHLARGTVLPTQQSCHCLISRGCKSIC